MNTEFLAGLLVARLVEGMRFAVGPTIAARKQALAAIGGFAKLKDYLAEDFVMGKFAAQAGMGVILSRNIVQHRIGSQTLRASISHRLRWVREHSPLAALGLRRPALHVSDPVRAAPLCLASGLVAGAHSRSRVAGLGSLVHLRLDFTHSPALGSPGPAGHPHLPMLAGRFLRQHHRVAGPPLLSLPRWPLRTALN